MRRLGLAVVAAALCACSSMPGTMNREPWGEVGGKPVYLYTLSNGGITAKITNYGTILVRLLVPDKSGKTADVVLGCDSLQEYVAGHPFFGAIAGRVANRIAKGRFTLGGKEYVLAVNNAPNHLHGGKKGFDKKVWDAREAATPEGPSLRMTLTSPDGDEGYPGAVRAEVIYTLTNDGALKIEMTATADKPTPVNLAHHTYWNLGGHDSGNVLDHVLTLGASRFTPTDETLIPTGEIKGVAGTPFDFTRPKKIGADIGALKAEQGASHGGGYDLNFVVDGRAGELRFVARGSEPRFGRVMELFSDQPGVQLYTGNGLGKTKGKGGAIYPQHAGFCLETQYFPDSINKEGRPGWPSVILRPGQTYRHVMIHKFSTS